ncbi:D-sedoheptulose 7-phosphate isomerase [Thermotoga sp. KOL6]|uniref:D-sedoheptulose 7-phosphate isomerase n=1 Tax=Thermotoga sp. KOL6 TaxID=126741 RepID=UPI000C78E011|nr:D-sedoheptulose 7-phosphate isomerase [Thermotoga sp. KOL6]PLV60042.1 phosphoheptose isomerase [Thermotoga sp. KOL6]
MDEKRIREIFLESSEIKRKFAEEFAGMILEVARRIVEKVKSGGKVILMGNGGSACDAQHIALELVGKFYKVRNPIPAICLNANGALLTEIGNDFGFENTFVRQIEAFATEKDVVVGISTSGKSQNVIRALERAKEIGALTIGFTGEIGKSMKKYCDYLFVVPSSDTPRIQETHITLGHVLAQIVEELMGG